MSILRIIGIILLVVGVVVLVFGVYNLISFNTSFGGKVANKVAGVFGTRTKAVQQAIVLIAVGAVCMGVGFFLYKRG
jgi:drug/metabolite transporter (DMT)-like permease